MVKTNELKPNESYVDGPSNKRFSDEQVDLMFEMLLPTENQTEFRRTLLKWFCEECGRPDDHKTYNAFQFYRRQCSNRGDHDYSGPSDQGAGRKSRDGLPLTYGEVYTIRQHYRRSPTRDRERGVLPNIQFVALVLQRGVAETQVLVDRVIKKGPIEV